MAVEEIRGRVRQGAWACSSMPLANAILGGKAADSMTPELCSATRLFWRKIWQNTEYDE